MPSLTTLLKRRKRSKDALLAEVRRLKAVGLTNTDIAKMAEVSEGAVRKWLKEGE